MEFKQISSEVRRQLVDAYLDYVGDWYYIRFSEFIDDKPAPASRFFADNSNSWQTGWAYVKNLDRIPGGEQMVNGVMRGSYLRDEFLWREAGGGTRALPTKLSCGQHPGDSGTIDCVLEISWQDLAGSDNRLSVRIKFELNIFSELTIRDTAITIRHVP